MRHEHGVALRTDSLRTFDAGGARWLALAAFAPASCDLVDDAGLVTAVAGLDPVAILSLPVRTWVLLGYFGGLGAALAWLARRLRPDDRLRLWAAVATLHIAYTVQAGLRGSALLAAVTLWGAASAFVRERRLDRGTSAAARPESAAICSSAPER